MREVAKHRAKQRIAFLIALLAGTLLPGCGKIERISTKSEPISGLRIQKIELTIVPDELEAPGTVIAADTAQVAARTMGSVVQVAVREGDTVRRGEMLVQLDDRELAARRSAAQAGSQAADAGIQLAQKTVVAAQANADLTRKTYDRYVYLKDQKSVSPQEFDDISAKQRAAQAQLEQAKAGLRQAQAGGAQAQAEMRAAENVAGYARIVAPFDGRVLRRMVEPGSLVSPGVPLFVVENVAHYQLQATLPAATLSFIKKGSPARVQLDPMIDNSLDGKVAEIEAGADPGSHTLNARIDLPYGAKVESGVFGRAFFAHGERKAVVVPLRVVVTRGQLCGIYAVDVNGLMHWRVVTLGQPAHGLVEVLSGVGPGDSIVTNPGAQELDGKRTAQVAAVGEENPR